MSVRRAHPLTITMALVDSASPPALISGLTGWASGEVQVSKDGDSFVDVASPPSEIGSTGVYKLILDDNETNARWLHIQVNKTGAQPFHLSIPTTGERNGAVVADGGNTSSTFLTDLTETDNDVWKDALLLFTSGALVGQIKKVGAYDGTTKFISTEQFTSAPSDTDRFLLINM